MNLVKNEKLENNSHELQFSIDAEAFNAAIAKAFKREAGKYNIPGFRKGKAPRHMIEKMFGADVFHYDAINDLFPEAYEAAVAESGIEQSCTWKPIAMELVGNDRPGIVRDITRVLTEQGVSLERLVTDVRPAPMSNEPLFHAEAILAVPLTLSLDVLQKRLETLADELLVDLKFSTEE